MRNINQYIWGLLGRFVPSFIFLGTTIVLARILTPDDFGLVGVLTIVFTVADALTDAGLGGSLVKEKEITNLDCCTICNFNMIVSILLYAILFISADYIENYFNMDRLAIVTRLLSLTFVINAVSLVPRALLMRDLKFRELFKISILSNAISAIVAIVAAFIGAGVFALILYRLLVPFVGSVLSYSFSDFKYRVQFSIDSFKRLIPFGFFSSISTIVDTIYENILTTIFGKVMGVTTTGYFYQAKKTEESITTSLTSTIGNVAFPVLTSLRDNKESFIKESQSIMLTVAGTMIPFILLLSNYSDLVIDLLYGGQWVASSPFFRLLMYAGCFMIMENLNRSIIKSLGKGELLFSIALIKRSIGIVVLLGATFMFQDYLVQAYIICSFIGDRDRKSVV